MTHPKLMVVLAAMLFMGSAGTALAQGTGGARAPSPGIGGGGIGGGGGTFIAPTPGIGTGASPGTGIPPNIGTGTPPNVTPTLGIGTTRICRHTHRRASKQRASWREVFQPQAFEREACKPRTGLHPRGHQGGNRGRYQLPTMSRQRQISERAADVPWSFRDFPLIGRTTRRNSASSARTHLVAADAFRY